ncbi:mitochondrial uncoupling protein 4 [Schistocerca americana]|uniref:mitochondrial uncoupling protein 4 n=1 Tax=Schistocerca americana TaxID=7009 RepID=UPI001F4F8F2B|nr:mitochondrial uncoupling protein 4 [Schistocerca americana]XP_047106748.1 mitochondrial uncoupling protein 4 [Schistocerca piceifrons]XP_049774604.1 mitochondrial uncoupling protein 4 [Schistocerca cancellata]XP_049801947.1 mitochondrial uncoupling protein 4 [Schistocerca nitens]XP_049852466.1 mitochondrial uncoupling protein 4 [Schistocerca gregaria]
MVPPPVPPKTSYADTFWCTYIVSVVAASIAEVVTYPLDLTKTRLQIQGEKAAAAAAAGNGNLNGPYRGMLQTGVGIVREEGFLKLWQGVTPAIYRHVVYSGIRIVTYEKMRDQLFHKDLDGSFPVWKSAISGVTSGALAQFVASPTDLVKVQIQMEGKRRLLGKPPRVHGTLHAFQKILAKGGIRGLWKGSIPNVQRAALVNLGDLTTYDSAKQFILTHTSLPDSHLTHMLSSGCAGLVAATMGTPADVVKTRIMNQPTDASGKGIVYKSSLDCLVKTVQNEGFLALYKGFLPVWIRMAPWSLTFWLSFEQIRHTIGGSAF